MDPTDARALVRAVARRLRVEPDAVLGRDRSARIVAVRRVVVLELRAQGLSCRAIGAVLSRDPTGVLRIARRALATSTPAPAR